MSAGPDTASDPYFDWAQATGFAGHSALAAGKAGFLPVLVKAPLSQAQPSWRVPQGYRERSSPFWTAWVPASGLGNLSAFGGEFAMSLPVELPSGKVEYAAPIEPSRADLVIGVIDQGCAFLNQAFSQAGDPRKSRLISLWRQRPAPTDGEWRVPGDFGYGLEVAGEQISRLLSPMRTPAEEALAYERLGYPVDDDGHFTGQLHGTHVLDIAAGLPQALPPEVNAKPSEMDAAAAASLVFVDLPTPKDVDATGAASDAFLLDAVHYILRRAGPQARVIINISVGSLAGPHDGSSLIEQALDDLVQTQAGRLSICVAAGNAALERWHASGPLRRLNHGESASLSWRTVPGDFTDSFLELWCFGEAGHTLPGLQVEVTAPDGQRLHASLPSKDDRQILGPQGSPEASLDLRLRPSFDNRPRALALLSLAPTAGPRAGQAAGVWRLKVTRQDSDSHCTVAAWLQRDTPGLSPGPVLQSELESVSANLAMEGSAATSALAGAKRLIVVGAFGGSDGRPSRYSPTSGIGAWAASDESPNALGKLCTGPLSGSVSRIAGTSAASPMVARALAREGSAASAVHQSAYTAASAPQQTRAPRVAFGAVPA